MWQIDTNTSTNFSTYGYGLCLDGTRLYSSHRSRLNIYDLTDANSPVLLSSTPSTSNYRFEDFDVAGGFLYVISGTGQFSVFDISDPTEIQLVEHHNTGGSLRAICASGSLLITVDLSEILRIYELDGLDGTAQLQGEVELQHQTSGSTRIATQNGLIFVKNQYGYECFDASNPSDPVFVATYNTPNFAQDIAVNGSILYLAAGGGIEAIDITDPHFPSFIHDSNDGVSISRLVVDGDTLCGSDLYGGVVTYDISDPALPELKGIRRPTTETVDVQLSGSTCYALGANRTVALDISDDRPRALLSRLTLRPNSGSGGTLHHSGGWLYEINELPLSIPSSYNQIAVARIDDPTQPEVLGTHTLDHTSRGFAAKNSVVFYANHTDGLVATDMADPNSPVVLDQLELGSQTILGLCMQDNVLFAQTYTRLLSVDVSNPESMTVLGDIEVSQDNLLGFATDGGHIFFVTNFGDIVIVNVSNPSQPVVEWVHKHPSFIHYSNDRIHMSVSDGLLVYSSDRIDYHFVDVSDPAGIVWLPTVPPQGHAAKPVLKNGRAYLYDEYLGLEIYDVTNPMNIVRVGLSGARHSTYGFVFIDDETCVMGGSFYGCDVVRVVSDCSPPCPADTNHDGMLSPADFSTWIAAFNTQAPECDQNSDGSCTPADFSAWVANFNAGC